MKPEDMFGANAGKVWGALKQNGALSTAAITKITQLKTNEIYGALGWLARENKIQIIEDKKGILYKLIE